MRFDLDDEQKAFQSAVSEFLEAECPLERALAPHESGEADYGLWQGLMSLGIGGILIPEEHGGLGLSLLDLAVVAEPLGAFAMPGPFLEHVLATLALVLGGTHNQQATWLPKLAGGEARATIALAEEKGVWLPDHWEMESAPRLSGIKRHVLHAEGAEIIIVGLKGGRLGVVRGDASGIVITPSPSTDAGKQLATIEFTDTPYELLDRPAGQRLVDAGLILLAADAFGGAGRCVDKAVSYAKEREQFGRPIGAFQALKHQLADMALAVQPAGPFYWYAAHAFGVDPPAGSQAAALAKAHITEIFPRVARAMIEAHGGIGYTWEFGAHIWLKRAVFDQAFLGMPQQHRLRVAQMFGWRRAS